MVLLDQPASTLSLRIGDPTLPRSVSPHAPSVRGAIVHSEKISHKQFFCSLTLLTGKTRSAARETEAKSLIIAP